KRKVAPGESSHDERGNEPAAMIEHKKQPARDRCDCRHLSSGLHGPGPITATTSHFVEGTAARQSELLQSRYPCCLISGLKNIRRSPPRTTSVPRQKYLRAAVRGHIRDRPCARDHPIYREE